MSMQTVLILPQLHCCDDTAGVVLSDPMDMIIMPDNPMNPYWNAGCAGAIYAFSYQGQSTVNYGGQTTRLDMASEMMSALASSSTTEAMLNGMFENSGKSIIDFFKAF